MMEAPFVLTVKQVNFQIHLELVQSQNAGCVIGGLMQALWVLVLILSAKNVQ